ncbi:hypothetical protein BDF14DRAFT_1847861 [Spinellus fusiger]|nr:hypothetical protein BDF14DRAFT_1847861 [Spinellus fusiger]
MYVSFLLPSMSQAIPPTATATEHTTEATTERIPIREGILLSNTPLPRAVRSVYEHSATYPHEDYSSEKRPVSFPCVHGTETLLNSTDPIPYNALTPLAPLDYPPKQWTSTSVHTPPEPLITTSHYSVQEELPLPVEATDPSSGLPKGWEYAYDEQGTIYYFNEATGESSWERPVLSTVSGQKEEEKEESISARLESVILSPNHVTATTTTTTTTTAIVDELNLSQQLHTLKPSELKQLELNQLHPEWIRYKGYVQMKMRAEKEDGGKLSSWKMYYAVLSNGFLLLYKEAYSKNKKPAKPLVPMGGFDLDSCSIDPTSKHETRRKHVFTITTQKKVKIYIQTSQEKEFSTWLDAIMRELIARKEGQNEESDIIRLLRLLTSDATQLKVNRKMDTEEKERKYRLRYDIEDYKSRPKMLGHWFSKSGRDGDKLDVQSADGVVSPASNDTFGGFLHLEEGGHVPVILRQCVQQVESRGLESVGIYRLSGPASAIQKYRVQFNQNEDVILADEQDINVVTGLLKLYFRELRNPLLTYEYYDWFIDAARISDYDERMFRIKSIIHVLPPSNYVVLEFLMRHLNRVALHSDINKMETSNLALIFSVGLLRTAAEDLSSIMQTDLQSKIIEAVIQQVDWFFDADLPSEDQDCLVNVT